MTLQEINLKAEESLNKYFLNSTDINHSEGAKKELSHEEIVAHINEAIKKQHEHLEALHALKAKYEKDAKTVMQYYVHESNNQGVVYHDTIDQMQEKLHENTVAQMEYVNQLKQQAMAK